MLRLRSALTTVLSSNCLTWANVSVTRVRVLHYRTCIRRPSISSSLGGCQLTVNLDRVRRLFGAFASIDDASAEVSGICDSQRTELTPAQSSCHARLCHQEVEEISRKGRG